VFEAAVCCDDPVSGAGVVASAEDVAVLDATLVLESESLASPGTGVDSEAAALRCADDVAELGGSLVVELESLVFPVAGVDVEETNDKECTIYVPSD
jgi:hypothetical protein